MYVGSVMHTHLVTVPPETSLAQAQRIIEERRINHLLVVDKKGELQGIVSDRDLKKSWASSATTLSKNELSYLLDQLTVASIMVRKTINIAPGTTIERAAYLMQHHRISALPVLEGEKLVGIITTTDVMQVLLEAIGIEQDSTRLTVLVRDRIGVIAEVSRILKEAGVNIRSLFSWPEKKHPGVYYLVLRVPAALGANAVQRLQAAGFKVLTEHLADLTPFLPEA